MSLDLSWFCALMVHIDCVFFFFSGMHGWMWLHTDCLWCTALGNNVTKRAFYSLFSAVWSDVTPDQCCTRRPAFDLCFLGIQCGLRCVSSRPANRLAHRTACTQWLWPWSRHGGAVSLSELALASRQPRCTALPCPPSSKESYNRGDLARCVSFWAGVFVPGEISPVRNRLRDFRKRAVC